MSPLLFIVARQLTTQLLNGNKTWIPQSLAYTARVGEENWLCSQGRNVDTIVSQSELVLMSIQIGLSFCEQDQTKQHQTNSVSDPMYINAMISPRHSHVDQMYIYYIVCDLPMSEWRRLITFIPNSFVLYTSTHDRERHTRKKDHNFLFIEKDNICICFNVNKVQKNLQIKLCEVFAILKKCPWLNLH